MFYRFLYNAHRAIQGKKERGSTSRNHKKLGIFPGGVLPGKFGRGVQPASQNPYPIYDPTKNLIPYL